MLLSDALAMRFGNREVSAALLAGAQVWGGSGLVAGYASAFAIDAGAAPGKTFSLVADSAITQSALHDAVSGAFPAPKLVPSGPATLAWSPHNLLGATSDMSAAYWSKSGATATAGQSDGLGGATASRIEATGATAAVSRSSVGTTGRWHTVSALIKPAGAAWCYITINDGTARSVWFDLASAAVGTVGAGLVGASAAPAAGGFVAVRVSVQCAAAMSVAFGVADADGSTAVTPGGSIVIARPHAHYGTVGIDWFANESGAAKAGTPIDVKAGVRRIVVEPAVTYNSLHSNDLSQAAWAKTGCTATVGATGPDGSPCSTLTATAPDATCLQSVASAASAQSFTVFVRRRTGGGAVHITTDGSTWVDVSESINASYFSRLSLQASANPVIGLRLAAGGDALDVAYALCADSPAITSPVPTHATAVTRADDGLSILLSELSASSSYSVYIDHDAPDDDSTLDGKIVSMRNAAGTQHCAWEMDAEGQMRLHLLNATAVSKYYPLYRRAPGERIQYAGSYVASNHTISVNAEPVGNYPAYAQPSMDRVTVGGDAGSNPVYLRRLLVVPEEIGDAVRTWRYTGGQRNSLITAELVARHGGVAGTIMCREPTMVVIDDNGAVADIALFFLARKSSGFHAEAPARIEQRNYRYTRASKTLAALTDRTPIYTPARWAEGLGHSQSPACFILPSGRAVLIFSVLDSASGTFTGDERSVYRMYNDTPLDPAAWTAPQKIIDAAALGTPYVIADTCGSGAVLPADHPVAPGRIATFVYQNTGFRGLYSDDGGATWTLGAMLSTPGDTVNESTVTLLPDGRLLATHRLATAPNVDRRLYSISDDGGVTYTLQGAIGGGYTGAVCAAGATQIGSSGFGEVLISRPIVEGVYTRNGTRIGRMSSDGAIRDEWEPWSIHRYCGYSSMQALFGGANVALAVEVGSATNNTDNSVILAVLDVPTVA